MLPAGEHRLRVLTLATLALLTAVPRHSLGADPQPDSMPCTDGAPPAGYHVEHHVVGLIVGGIGAAVFGVGAVMAIGGFAAKDDSDGVARAMGRGGLIGATSQIGRRARRERPPRFILSWARCASP